MSELSGSDMDVDVDVESGEQGSVPSSTTAASTRTVAPIANEDAASSTAIDLRCENCHMPYDGTEKAPQAGDCGHIQCGSCWEKTNCNKCCNETSPHDVFMSPRDLMSPEPEAQQPHDGGNDFRKEEGCTTAQTQVASSPQITAPQTQVASSAPITAPRTLGVASSLTSLASQTSSKTPAPSNISNTTPQTQMSSIASIIASRTLGVAHSLTSLASQTSSKTPAPSNISNTTPQTQVSSSAPITAPRTLGVASSLTSLASQTSSKTPAPSNISNINVKCINGTQVNAKVDTSRTTVHEMKREVHRQSGISTERQHLLYKGKTMSDTRTLKSYEVSNGATLQMGTKCYGG